MRRYLKAGQILIAFLKNEGYLWTAREWQTFQKVCFKNKLFLLNSIIIGALFFFVPGQNFYQTLEIIQQKPVVRSWIESYPAIYDYPENISGRAAPVTSARSVLVVDSFSNAVLYELNPNERLRPASTTKLMTALVALDKYKTNDFLLTDNIEEGGSKMGLTKGDEVGVEEILKGLLINSGNDAAEVLADNYPLGRKQFIFQMNQKAQELNMNNTHYTNVSGFDEPNHYTSSKDLLLLTENMLKRSEVSGIVGIYQTTVYDKSKHKAYFLKNVNKLLAKIPGVFGVKTGYTEEAGECLITAVKRDNREILTVVLGSTDRFGETEKLIDWVFKNYRWQVVSPTTRG